MYAMRVRGLGTRLEVIGGLEDLDEIMTESGAEGLTIMDVPHHLRAAWDGIAELSLPDGGTVSYLVVRREEAEVCEGSLKVAALNFLRGEQAAVGSL